MNTQEGEVPCPTCRKPFDLAPIKAVILVDREEAKSNRQSDKNMNGRDFLGIIPKVKKPCTWIQKSDQDKTPLPRSSKVNEIMAKILEWKRAAPKEKFIIFTEWLPFATILGRALMEQKINFVYFTVSSKPSKLIRWLTALVG